MSGRNESLLKTSFSNKAFRIASIYLALSLLWIFFTDKLVFRFISDVETLNLVSSIKGWFFVAATTLLLFDLIRRALNEVASAKHQLIETEIKFRSIFENSVDAIGVGKEGKHVFVNPAHLKLFGYTSLDEIIGTPVIDLITPNRRGQIANLARRRERGETVSSNYETVGLRKDGSEFDMEVNVSNYLFESENYTVVIIRDVTERKNALNTIRESEKRYHILSEISPVGIFRTDSTGSTTYVNPRWCQISGISAQEAMGIGWLAAVHPDDRDKLLDNWRQVTKSHVPSLTEYRFLHSDGNVIWVMGNAVPEMNSENKIAGYVGTVTDITDRVLVEEKEKIYSKRISTILESIGDGFVSLDMNWCYTYVNRKAGEFFNYDPEALVGKNIWEEFPETVGKLFHLACEKAMREQTNIQITEYYPPYNKWFENRIYPTANGLSIFFQDITERKLADVEIETKNEELKTLNRIILKTLEAGELHNQLEYIIDEVLHVVDLEGGMICLLNSNETFDLVVNRDVSAGTITNFSEHKVKIGECLCGNCAKSHKPLILNNREEVLANCTGEILRSENLHFHAAFPIVIDERCVGVLCVFGRTDKRPTQRSLELLETIVAQTALLIESSTLNSDLKKSEEKFAKAFQNSPDAISISRASDGLIVDVNESFLRMSGYKRSEVIGFSANDLNFWVNFGDRERYISILKKNKRVLDFETIFRTREGQIRNFLVSGEFIELNNGLFILGILRDITEQKQAFEELQKSRQEFRALSAHLQKVRENERAAIAREMHDELGQILTSLKMNIAFTRRELEESNAAEMKNRILKEFQSMNMTLDKAVSEVRKLITQLRPELLDKLGLIAALEWYSEEYQKSTKIDCVFTTEQEELFLDHDKELAIFRIVQEAMTNVAKHSAATSVQIQVSRGENELSIEIVDNGRGILENETEGTNSFGLMGMRERAILIGGELRISGTPGEGTTVRLVIGV